MFKKARLKLTFWYIGILLLVSGLFSGLVYQRVSLDIERGFHRGMMHMRNFPADIQQNYRPPIPLEDQLFLQDIRLAKKNLFYSLLIINGIIVLISGVGSYYLAGKTLEPIQITLKKQKRFVADAAHELKTPITALRTSLEVNLLDKKIPDKFRKILQENLDDVKNLQNLSVQLLQLAKSDNYFYKKQKFKLKSAVKEVVRKLQPLIKAKKLDIEISIPSQKIINFDKQGFQQIMTILIDNAIKFSHNQGKIKIISKLHKGKTQIIVQDYGIGIAKKDLPFIFDRFYQAQTSRTKSQQSSFGLGLSLAQNIAKKNHIQIYVESQKGKGSSFFMYL